MPSSKRSPTHRSLLPLLLPSGEGLGEGEAVTREQERKNEHEYEYEKREEHSSVPSPPFRWRGQGEGEVETIARGRSNTARRVADPAYFRNVATLICQAAEALQHAHDHGIIHRDIKPGNLLLDTSGTLFVTDFGLARIETGAGVTMTGDVLGTLRYMSPEQVQANRTIVDHRTDIYSLGATLYELLTLQPMWPGDDKAELIRRISFEEPVRPKHLSTAIPTDLETIVMKAVSKNPSDRYDSAQAFAADLQCLLSHKPISAQPPTLTQRLNKWARGHSTLVTTTFVILVIFSIASVISTAMILNANGQTRRALAQSEKSLDGVIDTINRLLWRVGESQLEDVPGADQLRSELLNDALEICNSLLVVEDSDPRAHLRAIEALSSLGSVQAELDVDAFAGDTLESAISQFKHWIIQHPNHPSIEQARRSMASTFIHLGSHYLDLSEFEKAADIYKQVLALDKDLDFTAPLRDRNRSKAMMAVAYGKYSTVLNKLNRDRESCDVCKRAVEILEGLVKAEPVNATYQVYLGWTFARLASSHDTLRERDLAARYFEQAVSLLRAWCDQSTNRPWANSILATTCINYAIMLTNDDQARATELIEEAKAVFSKLHRQFPDHPDYQASLASCHEQFGKFQRIWGKHKDTILLLEQSLPLRRDLVRRFPERPDYRSDLASTLLIYGATLDHLDDTAGSETARTESNQLFDQLANEHPEIPDYRSIQVRELYNTGLLLDQQGRPDLAESWLHEAASISDRLTADFPDVLAYCSQQSDIHSARGACLLALQEGDAALKHTEKAIAILRLVIDQEPANPSYQEKMLNLQINLAASQCSLGKFKDAQQTFLSALPHFEQRTKLAPGNSLHKSNFSGLLANIALTCRELGQHALAVEYMQRAIDVDEELLNEKPNAFVRLAIAAKTEVLLEACSMTNDPDKLAMFLSNAERAVKTSLDNLDSNELLFKKLVDVAYLSGRLGARTQSVTLLQLCLQSAQREFGIGHEHTLTAANCLGLAELNVGDLQSAQLHFAQVVDECSRHYQDQPDNTANALMLGGAYCNLGNVESQINIVAIATYTSAIEVLESITEPLEDRNPFLINSYHGRAEQRRRVGLCHESLADFDRAIELAGDGMVKAELQLKRLKAVAQNGDHTLAANTADELLRETGSNQFALAAASVFAIAAEVVLLDEGLSMTERQQFAEKYQDRAFELLEIARHTSLPGNATVIRAFLNDRDSAALKSDRRFGELIAELDGAPKEKQFSRD